MSSSVPAWMSQHPYRTRMEWGPRGALAAAARGDVLVIVDTLRFSTAAAAAVHRGALIFPCGPEEDPERIARRAGGQVGGRGRRFSLSPGSYEEVEPGTRIVLPSPNGAACIRFGESAPRVFAGALVNAAVTAAAVSAALERSSLAVTVIACGERWPGSAGLGAGEDGLRPAAEDYLGAGAILSRLSYPASPEARLCAGAFLNAEAELEALLWECASGRELRERGSGDDVRHAARLDRYDTAVVLREDHLDRWVPGNDGAGDE